MTSYSFVSRHLRVMDELRPRGGRNPRWEGSGGWRLDRAIWFFPERTHGSARRRGTFSKLSSDAEIPKETVRRYYGLLEDTLLILRLPPFKPRLKLGRRVTQRDRFVFFDIGVRNALLGLHRHPLGPDQVGSAFEQWMICQVTCLNRALRRDWLLSSYRTDAGAEVDLVVETGKAVIGVEIKAGRSVRPPDCRGLQSLAETVGRYKRVEKYVVYAGTERQTLGDVKVVPYLTFLRHLVAED